MVLVFLDGYAGVERVGLLRNLPPGACVFYPSVLCLVMLI